MWANYRLIKIYTSEDLTWRDRPIDQAVLELLKERKIPARCLVTRSIAGYYETGELVSGLPGQGMFNLPLAIEIVIPAGEFQTLKASLLEMVGDGLVAVEKLHVISSRRSETLIPKQMQIREVMTTAVAAVNPLTPIEQVVRKMLAASLKAIPVIDDERRVVGIITQQNLSDHPHLPLRLGLLARLEPKKIEAYLDRLPLYTAGEMMSRPVITVNQSQHVADAVRMMLKHRLKRLPVVDDQQLLVGMVSRIDILRAANQRVLRQRPLPRESHAAASLLVREVGGREQEAVQPETPIAEVVQLIFGEHIQRVAVVDQGRRLVGIVSDYDLLPIIRNQSPEEQEFLISQSGIMAKGRQFPSFLEKTAARSAGEIMNPNVIAIREDSPVAEALRIMVERELKRLPVLGEDGKFHGMITREALLRAISK
jgi:CBS-domain-containing membrane protein